MEAYDAAVLSYALATAATKIKPGLLGIGPILPNRILDSESLTPPTRHTDNQENSDNSRSYLYQLLINVDQQIINKNAVTLNQLMEICSTKQAQMDQQIIAHLEALQNELKQICKANPTITHQLHLKCEEDEGNNPGVSLRTEVVCKTLSELLKHFGLTVSANTVKKAIGN